MKDLQFLRNVSIGQYIQRNSPVHNLHPGVKLGLLLLIFTTILAAPGILPQGVLFIFTLVCIKVSRLSIPYILRGLLPALPYLVFIGVLQILFMYNSPESSIVWTSPALFSYRVYISIQSLVSVAMLFMRFFNMMVLLTLFSAATNTNELTSGVEQLLTPLKIIRFPAHEAALILAITFRFIPILAGEGERIVKAQAARGADFGTNRGGPIKRMVRFFPILLPLFQSALTRAEELIEAMEAKCYTGGEGRTSYTVYRIRPVDIAAALFIFATCAAVLILGYSGIL